MRALTLATLLVACGTPAPPPPGDAAPEVTPPAADPLPSASNPLEGCPRIAIEATESWSCGPHRVVRVSYPNGLPPDRPGTWVGDPPTRSTLDVSAGERTIQAVVMTQPELDGARMVNVTARDEAGGQIASCSLRLQRGQDADAALAWCGAALGEALAGAPAAP